MTLIDTVCCTDSVYVVYYEYTDTLMSACPILIMWQPLLKAGQLTVANTLNVIAYMWQKNSTGAVEHLLQEVRRI